VWTGGADGVSSATTSDERCVTHEPTAEGYRGPERRKRPRAVGSRPAEQAARIDDKLDAALADTFPASDPVALTQPAPSDEPPEPPPHQPSGGEPDEPRPR
jgi:hypothetical protein